MFVSINRFERKKGVELAVQAFTEMLPTLPSHQRARCQLVLAGGYDPRLSENVSVLQEMRACAIAAGLTVIQGSADTVCDDGDALLDQALDADERTCCAHVVATLHWPAYPETPLAAPLLAPCLLILHSMRHPDPLIL